MKPLGGLTLLARVAVALAWLFLQNTGSRFARHVSAIPVSLLLIAGIVLGVVVPGAIALVMARVD
jgi:hypothetical protein